MKPWVAGLAVLLFATAALAEEPAARMSVTGEGAVDSAPDMATITLGVQNEAETAREAMDLTSAAVAAILEQLAADGLAPRDMQTRDLSLSPLWSNSARSLEREEPRIVGFQASNNVVVRVRDLDALGGILDRVIENGANTFNGLGFGLQDPVPALDEARRAAVAEAKRKAELYAEAAGLTLGQVLSLEEVGGSDPIPMARMAMAESVPVAQGEVTTTARVTMVFAISPSD